MGTNSLHTNQDLFSNHYLEEILPEEREWRDHEGIEEAFEGISKLYKENLTRLPALSEPQLENDFIRPILEILGHHYIVQPREKTAEGIRRPDYALFDTESAKKKASTEKGKEWELFNKAIGLCEAKHWNRKLDLSSRYEPDLFDFEYRNPAYQMHLYLLYSEVRWGILTNGRIWRLYEREQSKHLDRYYEVNLVSLINSDGPLFAAGVSRDEQLEAFKYFYMFFRCQAFPRFLDYVLDGSVRYAEAVGAELKDNVYKALRILAQGFVEFKENRLEPVRDKELIRENCFVLLYRLLFILYAEDKLLLPISNRSYLQHYSLESMKEEIYARKDGPPYGGSIPMLWGKLSALSTLIDQGEKDLGIAPYNGGLFDDNQHEFLKKYKIGDRWLAEVIDLLSRPQTKTTPKKEFIDYSSLKIRDLGSIYEGLLENHLEVASEPMVAVKKGKKEQWKPLRERKEEEISKTTDSVGKGEYYPVTERGDRKATGSYYTPDYIVKYIVEHTLEPLTKDIKEKELLSLRVLDPAMGSGHFLVEATDFLAPKLLGVKEIEETEDEIGKAKRLIIERCIFGVDKNPLAVELAKLSLWLSTVAANKPLSFLDHHLRPGDSLIGAKVAELGNLPGEKTGSLFQQIVEHYSARTIVYYKQIEDEPSDTIDQIDDKIKRLKQARGMMKPFRQAADVWVSTYFGNEVKPKDYSRLVEALRQDDKKAFAALEREKWVDKATKLWNKHHFFHWELEFPEVFFDKHGRPLANPGFDAVIGNPPYDVLEKERKGISSPHKELGDYVKNIPLYEAALGGKLNLYRLFIVRALGLLQRGDRFGMIVPLSLVADISCSKARRNLMLSTCELLADCFPQKDNSKRRIFKDAKLSTTIVTCMNEPQSPKMTQIHIRVFPGNSFEDECREALIKFDDLVLLDPNNIPIPLVDQSNWEVCRKMYLTEGIVRLAEEDTFDVRRGEINQTIYSKFITSDSSMSRLLKGVEIGRYYFQDVLSQGEREWFDEKKFLEDGNSIPEEVFKRRIATQRITGVDEKWRIVAMIIKPPTYFADSTNSITLNVRTEYDLYYLMGLLNSKLFQWRFKITSTNNNVGTNEVESMPIRTIDFSKPEDKKMHNDMVELVQAMLDLHKRKQEIVKEYSGWLEHLIGAKLAELSGRERIRGLEKLDDANALADLIAKNRKLAFNTREPRNYELLSKGFDKYKNKLTPVVTEIAETDREIDRLVYKLYALTPEEIEIVEGKGNPCKG
ncbi:hypothetical protein CEE36_03260 [candidate division TA06 bacterium B3_TA06]|uniref:site-specific DNA-methyltransferase (adenine-specific) n=1 Tax=candidate division TA06 bacterium B3_TA06 TaxID=2012487 RepID=A0A532V976_UNCT6|nr:MAG: hypothetical protein CEE36_03260 [candidate division TA06 bacterium B3_TA06]